MASVKLPGKLRDLSEEVCQQLKEASSVAVFTGAGISAESGVPTFRGENGLWEKFRPEELANFNAFIENPEMVQNWYAYRRKILHGIKPNRGHHAIAKLETLVKDFILITQNVDNLHRVAGSENIVELHGNILKNYCIKCGGRYDGKQVSFDVTGSWSCHCGGLIRPDVVWFGEVPPEKEFQEAERFCRRCDILLTVGTSGIVHPAAGLPIRARGGGAFMVEINPEATELSSIMDVVMRQEAGTVLPSIVESLA